MEYFIDVGYDSINKYSEELCGDKVEVVQGKDSTIVVLADGLGSGVKANILSTLTASIACTMLKKGENIFEVVDTLSHTLPRCEIRQLAYSTFSILQIFQNGEAYIVEFDNPPLFYIHEGQIKEIQGNSIFIYDKKIKESRIHLEEGDMITIVSDGVIHAGIGGVLNLGWQWEQVSEFLLKVYYEEKKAKNISKRLIETCQNLYLNKPGDDTTAVTIKIRKAEWVSLFSGPPEDPTMDRNIVMNLMKAPGKKIVCGGTAGNIVARELGEELCIDLDSITPKIPPMGKIKGIDLVTEGVLTLCKTVEIIEDYFKNENSLKRYSFNKKDGAVCIARTLIEECTHLQIFTGNAINPAHQNPEFPSQLSIKRKVIQQLVKLLKKIGIKVIINYV
ncbi:SpoIIE family protein phosphatase [Garciella nitratireducens]|uniref:Stage II sporulation protein E (SpoIIE) n=1 Tax=Garciella nitratireducens DSM 15102 TaxID=1121911 RepID=A0A1T4KQJ6_9FIRM|nr:SpoIIE family protein phosphatase [Garciella nitratireducens]SJZ44672.1 Stage II sporulation protein E (SpoIIE) [Garciella nitratireducens DSM 15102]